MAPFEVMIGTVLFGLGVFAVALWANRRLRRMREPNSVRSADKLPG